MRERDPLNSFDEIPGLDIFQSVYVCERGRDKERERMRERDQGRERVVELVVFLRVREGESACASVCVNR